MPRTTSVRPRSEDALLRRFRATGDPEALGALFDATAATLFRIALALAPHPAAAEDALQETFLAVLDGPEAYDPARPALPWLVGVLRNRVREVRQREGRTPDPRRLEPPVPLREPATEAERAERRERVRRALVALPAPYREVALLRWRYGLEPAEIAEVKGIPPGTVGSLLSRAKERLRRTLAGLASLLVFGPGREGRGLGAVRSEILRRAARPAKAASWIGIGLLGGALMTKKAVAIAGAAALMIAAAGIWAVGNRDAESPPRSGSTADGDRPGAPAVAPPPSLPALEEATRSRDAAGGALPWSASLSVTVRTLADEPIEGASVEVHPWKPPNGFGSPYVPDAHAGATSGGHAASGTTDAAGRLDLTGIPPGIWTVSAWKEGYARTRGFATAVDGAPGETVRLYLGRGWVLSGRVVSRDGKPIPGAVVKRRADDPHGSIADARGHFRLVGLPRGKVDLFAARPGGTPGHVASLRIPEIPEFEIVLPDPTVLEGRVTEEGTGRPVAGVSVRASFMFGIVFQGRTTTDADGKYRIDTLPPGTVSQIDAEKEGYALLSPPPASGVLGLGIVLREGETIPQDLVLGRAARLEGRVLGPDGPVAGASVHARSGASGSLGARNTDAEGRFAFTTLGPGTVSLWVFAAGLWHEGGGQVVELPAGETSTVDITLSRGATVAGRVERPDGRAIAGATVGRGPFGNGTATGEDGEFTLTGVRPESGVEIRAEAPGFVPDEVDVPDLAPGVAVRGIVLRLRPAPRVEGTLSAPEQGRTLVDASVEVVAVTGRTVGAMQPAPEMLTAGPFPVRVDGSYEGEIPWTDTGTFRIVARWPGHLDASSPDRPLVPGREVYRVDLTLPRGRTLKGQVFERDLHRPVAGARISHGGMIAALTDGSGAFEVEEARAAYGKVPLSVEAEGYVPVNLQVEEDRCGSVVVEIEPALTITGSVRFPEGTLVPADIQASGRIFTTVRSLDGRFVLDGIPAGQVHLVVTPVEGPLAGSVRFLPATIDVPAGARDVVVTVQPLPEGEGVIAGRVVGEDGRPLPGIALRATSTAERGWTGRTTTGEDGSFALDTRGTGPFTVTANPPSASFGPFAGRTDLASARKEEVLRNAVGLEFVLRKGLVLSGALRDDEGRPIPQAMLSTAGRVVVTGVEGEFTFRGLEPGDYRIALIAPRDFTLRGRDESHPAGTEGIRLVAEKSR